MKKGQDLRRSFAGGPVFLVSIFSAHVKSSRLDKNYAATKSSCPHILTNGNERWGGGESMRDSGAPWVSWVLLVVCFMLAVPASVPEMDAPVSAPAQVEAEEPDMPVVALTFDDGPRSSTTGRLLDELAVREVPATFFLLGHRVEGNEDLVRRMAEEGHQIGVHTFDHVEVTGLSRADFDLQVGKTRSLLSRIPAALRQHGRLRPGLGGQPHHPVVGGPGRLAGRRCGPHRGRSGGTRPGRRHYPPSRPVQQYRGRGGTDCGRPAEQGVLLCHGGTAAGVERNHAPKGGVLPVRAALTGRENQTPSVEFSTEGVLFVDIFLPQQGRGGS